VSLGLALGAISALLAGNLDLRDRITVGTFYSAHPTAISSETWMAYEIARGYSLGIAYAWETRRVRPISTVRFLDETSWHPGLTYRSGFRGVADGRVTDSLIIDKRFGNLTLEGGLARSGPSSRGVATVTYRPERNLVFGLQADGRNSFTFVNFSHGPALLGAYLVNGKHPAYLLSWRF